MKTMTEGNSLSSLRASLAPMRLTDGAIDAIIGELVRTPANLVEKSLLGTIVALQDENAQLAEKANWQTPANRVLMEALKQIAELHGIKEAGGVRVIRVPSRIYESLARVGERDSLIVKRNMQTDVLEIRYFAEQW